ncbi:MAG: 50S ribosomal protein L23 [Deltaproteobacteria bacterium]|nr:50S ribosomal protein L23 [Deltaproteobacteria bacterium]
MQTDPNDILIRPVVTERATDLRERNQYVFEVPLAANKAQIAQAVKALYDKKPVSVRTMVVRGKFKNRRGGVRVQMPFRKKAIVTLAAGETIDEILGPK